MIKVLAGDIGLRYRSPQVEAMSALGAAVKERSLHQFNLTLSTYADQLTDPFVQFHLDSLRDKMLEENLIKILKPYTAVQVDHVADKINLTPSEVGLVQYNISTS